MRTAIGIGVVILVALVVQSTLLPLLGFGSMLPDLMLVVCVYLGLHVHSPAGAVGAFTIGYVQDSLSGTLLGLNAFAMCLVFATVYLTSRRLWVDNLPSKVVLVFLASLQKTAVVIVLVGLFFSFDGLWQTVARYVLLQAVIAAALSPPIFAILARTVPVVVDE